MSMVLVSFLPRFWQAVQQQIYLELNMFDSVLFQTPRQSSRHSEVSHYSLLFSRPDPVLVPSDRIGSLDW